MILYQKAIVTMLASARIGAIHSLVFGGFASKELATRINHAKPKIIVSANVGVEPNRLINYKNLLDHAIELAEHKPLKCIFYNRKMVFILFIFRSGQAYYTFLSKN
jgi:propionyl-CoA synthetase